MLRRPAGVTRSDRGGRPAAAGVRQSLSAAGGDCPISKLWTSTWDSVEPRAFELGDQRLLEGQPDAGEVRRVLGLRHDPDRLARCGPRLPRQVEDLGQRRDLVAARRTRCWPAGSRAAAPSRRSVRSSARVKSSVNQPVTSTPSMVLVVRRLANSARVDTSVVPLISFSCRATSTPSEVLTTSGSITSAPCRWPARTRPACARVGSRWRRGARSRWAAAAPPGWWHRGSRRSA